MDELVLICPRDGQSPRLDGVLQDVLRGRAVLRIERAADFVPLSGRTVLFAVSVWDTGINAAYYAMLGKLRGNPGFLQGCRAALVVDGGCELYTKALARELVFAANQAGCAFIGKPLIEATGSLQNFHVQAKLRETDCLSAYHACVEELIQRLQTGRPIAKPYPKILALHASSRKTSNTLQLWDMVKTQMEGHAQIQEIGLRNGSLTDCNGCSYHVCLHFGEKESCFYGGVMVEEVYPAVRDADAVVWICPNYNDALAANLTACVNRLSALFRTTPFYEKALFGIIVSGYSGGDLIAQQLISALCMNKAFWLPARFSILETANDAGAIVRLPGIEERARGFAENMLEQLRQPH